MPRPSIIQTWYRDCFSLTIQLEIFGDCRHNNVIPNYITIQGNITGQNEFVVYNMYRVMPEYVIEYTDSTIASLKQRVNHLNRLVNHAIKTSRTATAHAPRRRSTKRKKY